MNVRASMTAPVGGVPPPPAFDWAGSQKRMQVGIAQQQQGAQQEGEANAQAAHARAQSLAEQAKAQEQQAQQSMAARDAAYTQYQAESGKIRGQLQQLAEQKIDPNHWWESRTGAQKAFARLGLAFSAMGAAFTGQPPVNLIKEEVDRDIDAQQRNIENKRSSLREQQGLLAENFKLFGNMQDARDATSAMMLQALAKKGEAAAQNFADQAQRAHALQVSGELAAKGEGMLQDVHARRYQQYYQGTQLGLERQRLELEAGKLAVQQRMTQAKNTVQVGGVNIPIADEKQAEELRAMLTAASTMRKSLGENTEALKRVGFFGNLRHKANEYVSAVGEDPDMAAAMAAQDSAAMSANHAHGNMQAMPENQYRDFKHSVNTPTNPDASKAAGDLYNGGAARAIAAKLIALGKDPEWVRAVVAREFADTGAGTGIDFTPAGK
jgi:hypothetical protein